MKRFLLLIALLAPCAWAQTPTPRPVVAAEHPAHNELRALRADMEKAMNALDVDGLLRHVTDDVVFSTMNGDVVRGKQGIKDYFHKMMTGPEKRVASLKTHFEADDLTVLYGEDAGVAFGHSDDEYRLTDGSEFAVHPRWSAAMVRQNGKWKIANFHYSVNMFDNPVTNTVLQKTYWAVAAGAFAGLLLGGGLGFVLGSRRR
jgi:uncharacterized protein (TIGR02246 family)